MLNEGDGYGITRDEALGFLMRVHYGFFMRNPRFWYERDLQAADMLIVAKASELHHEGAVHELTSGIIKWVDDERGAYLYLDLVERRKP